jgi:phytoene dehydrogenase-like protein
MESRVRDTDLDVIVIGCGMSGLATGIRAALDGKRVLILESHNAAGGLNGFYFQAGRKLDVGLHAVTNYLERGEKGPLSKIFRQLRLSRDAFVLAPQFGSRIAFPGVNLRFTNDFEQLESDVAEHFPTQVDGFRKLRKAVLEFDALDLSAPGQSAREVLKAHIPDSLLEDMLLCPLMYYGSSWEHDMDFGQFVTLWRAIFEEGFGRPVEGVRVIIRALLNKYRELGGERRMKCRVSRILKEGNRAVGVELANGELLYARRIISTIGAPETFALSGQTTQSAGGGTTQNGATVGRLSFVETIHVLDELPEQLGLEETIVFFNSTDRFAYEQAVDEVDLRSGVICCPNNYAYADGAALPETWLRVTALANYAKWTQMESDAYVAAKASWSERILEQAISVLPRADLEKIRGRTQHHDMFTPRTIERYTGHFGGAVYGSPEKFRTGETPVKHLYIAGTDQGFLGIVGAMLSGISVANLHIVGSDLRDE